MADAGSPSFWPDGLARSYWNYDALTQARDIPFMGYEFNTRFMLALLAGAVVVVVFAVRRFNTKSYPLDSFRYRVLEELVPMKLRRAELMRGAYTRYAFALVLIYLALTFFGKLIIQTFNSLPVAGLQVDASSFEFDSPNWPLLVSFGMIGLAPMLPFVEAAENKIRAWSHKAVGIPVQIAELTNRVKRGLDALTVADLDNLSLPKDGADIVRGKTALVPAKQPGKRSGALPTAAETQTLAIKASKDAPSWLAEKIDNKQTVERAYRTRMQLEWLTGWSHAESAYWPAATVRGMLRGLEDEEVAEAEEVLRDFRALEMEDYKKPSGTGDAALPESDRLDAHRRRLERNWHQITARMEELRDELASILVIYAEHDRAVTKIENPGLEWVMTATVSDSHDEDGPEFWVALSLLPIFGLYYWAIHSETHPRFSDVLRTWQTVAVSAGLETARVVVLFLVPLLAVMSMRHFLLERSHDPWKPVLIRDFDKTSMRQLVKVSLLAFVIAAIGMGLFALFQGALLSTSPDRLSERAFSNGSIWLQFFMSQAGVSVIFVIAVIIAVDAVRFGKGAGRDIVAGAAGGLGAMAVAVAWSWHVGFWLSYGGACNAEALPAFWVALHESFWQPNSCYTGVAATNMLVYMALTALSATVFLSWRRRTDGNESNAVEKDTSRLPAQVMGGVVILLVGVALGMWATRAAAAQHETAQSTDVQAEAGSAPELNATNEGPPEESRSEGDIPRIVRVGIRTDVEPFAYRVDLASGKAYLGYLAEFCKQVFPPSGTYQLEFVEVTATNRFDSFRRDDAEARGMGNEARVDVPAETKEPSPEIDVLCDPSTLRFSEDDGREEGVFSPPVFISGVSYIRWRYTGPTSGQVGGSVILGYVAGSTARDVALAACRGNLFKVIPKPTENCEELLENRRPDSCYPQLVSDASSRTYRFCELSDHRAAIEWFCARSSPTPTGSDDAPETLAAEEFLVERAYIGDRDIIIGKYENHIEDDPACRFGTETNFETFTYEPYALIIRRDDADLIQHVQRRVYEIFSNRPLIDGIFTGAFTKDGKPKGMTPALASLFLLNAVEQPGEFSEGSTDRNGTGQ